MHVGGCRKIPLCGATNGVGESGEWDELGTVSPELSARQREASLAVLDEAALG